MYAKKNAVVTALEKRIAKLKLEKNNERKNETIKPKEYDFRNSLLASIEQPFLDNDFEQMLIVVDLGYLKII